MTQAAGAREHIASPWKHTLASVSTEEHRGATLELLYTDIGEGWISGPRHRKGVEKEGDPLAVSPMSCLVSKDIEGSPPSTSFVGKGNERG